MITITRAVQTCMACPSQWNLWSDNGDYYYARYRHGCGELRQYKTEHWYHKDEDEFIADIAEFYHGDPLDGMISLEEFAQLAGITIAPDAMITGYGDHLRDEMITSGFTGLLDE